MNNQTETTEMPFPFFDYKNIPPNGEDATKLLDTIKALAEAFENGRVDDVHFQAATLHYYELKQILGRSRSQIEGEISRFYDIKNGKLPSLSSAKELYEPPTNYKASYELEKSLRIWFEEENKKLREKNRKVKELTFQRDKAWEDEGRAIDLKDMYKQQDEELRETISDLRGECSKLEAELSNEKGANRQLRSENGQLIDNLKSLQSQHNSLNESNLALRKSVAYHSSFTAYLYLAIFLAVATLVALFGLFYF
jgi:DNA repair exonuclease SbcCD ATPase subunit